MYGTWFAKDATASEIVKKCEQRINLYEKWKKNLEELKAEKHKEAQEFNTKTKAITEKLNSLTEEERSAFFKYYKYTKTTLNRQEE